MRLFYNENSIYMQITMDYYNTESMNRLCEMLVCQADDKNLWIIEGIYLNHALDEYDILEAQKRLDKLFEEKNQSINVREREGKFAKDNLVLSQEELVKCFADFAVYYMQATVKAEKKDEDIIEFGTESDSNYVYIKVNHNCGIDILRIMQYVGIDKLEEVRCEKSNLVWNDNIFCYISERYPEIRFYIENKMRKLKEEGWQKAEEYIKSYYWKKEKKLVYRLTKATGETVEMPLLKIQGRYTNPALLIALM